MKIELKIDYEGNPYLELNAGFPRRVEDELLEHFIRKALEKGIEIKNEADMDTRTDYASIRLKNLK